jgi:hypothetical protein
MEILGGFLVTSRRMMDSIAAGTLKEEETLVAETLMDSHAAWTLTASHLAAGILKASHATLRVMDTMAQGEMILREREGFTEMQENNSGMIASQETGIEIGIEPEMRVQDLQTIIMLFEGMNITLALDLVVDMKEKTQWGMSCRVPIVVDETETETEEGNRDWMIEMRMSLVVKLVGLGMVMVSLVISRRAKMLMLIEGGLCKKDGIEEEGARICQLLLHSTVYTEQQSTPFDPLEFLCVLMVTATMALFIFLKSATMRFCFTSSHPYMFCSLGAVSCTIEKSQHVMMLVCRRLYLQCIFLQLCILFLIGVFFCAFFCIFIEYSGYKEGRF